MALVGRELCLRTKGEIVAGSFLGHQLGIGAVAVAGHSIRDHGGRAGFRRPPGSPRSAPRQQGQDQVGPELGDREGREAGDAVEAGADGLDPKLEDRGDGGGGEHRQGWLRGCACWKNGGGDDEG